MLNTYNRMMTYDQLGQMRGYPSSEQGRDERHGWLGASGTYIENEAAHLGSAAIFSRWLDDVRLDQRADGCIPGVSPSYWVMYNNDVVWPADIVLIPAGIHKYFGDKRVLAANYPAMKKWMSWVERSILPDGTVNLNAFGDWCDTYSMDRGKTIGATSRPLISTAYVAYLYHLMALSAEVLNEAEDVNAYRTKAEKMKSAFNKRFFDPKSNTYASKTQCASVLPLAFGLVPEANRAAVIKNLIRDIEVTHNDHLTVGLVGMGYYMRTLSNIGHADVAYKLTQQTTRPSWGYMVNKGATGMWERWDMDTLGPEMNGQGFKMLAGDLHAFLYQNIAGIAPDILNPGFKHIILKPEPVDGMIYVNASYKSMYGPIVSNWKRENDTFKWQVTIPTNTTATLYVPAKDTGSVTESGKPAGKADHVRFIRMQDARVVFEVGSGDYEFGSTIK